MKNALPLTIALAICFGLANAQGSYTINSHGANAGTSGQLHSNRINLVILADGYKTGESGLFDTHVNALIHEMFSSTTMDNNSIIKNSTPYSDYRDYFNIYWVWVQSDGRVTCKHPIVTPPATGPCGGPNPDASTCFHCETDPTCNYLCLAADADGPPHFGTSYDNEGLHRFLLPEDPEWVINEVQGTDMFNDNTSPLTVVIMANAGLGSTDNSYFGGGGLKNIVGDVGLCAVSTSYLFPADPFIDPSVGVTNGVLYPMATVIHELGHSFVHLLDEYWYDVSSTLGWSNEGINRTDNSVNNSSHPWYRWIQAPNPPTPNDATVGVHQHYESEMCYGVYTNALMLSGSPSTYYKPTTAPTSGTYAANYYGNCRMESIQKRFCPVCKEAIVEKIHSLVNPIEDVTPPENTSTTPLEANENLTFTLTLLEPDPCYMTVDWYIDDTDGSGAPVHTSTASPWEWSFDCALGLDEGIHTVTARVRDLTGVMAPADNRLVRIASHSDHYYDANWFVQLNSNDPDLYMLDNVVDNGADDAPDYGYAFAWGFFDQSQDVWVRDEDDLVEDVTYQPSLASSPEYVHVRIGNRGCTSNDEEVDALHVYTSTAANSSSWSTSWITAGNGLGYEVGEATIPVIAPGANTIISVPWTVQDVTPGYVNWGTCILARIEGLSYDPITEYPGQLEFLVSRNNNVAMRNTFVVDLAVWDPPVELLGTRVPPGGFSYVGNPTEDPRTFNIHLGIDKDATGKVLTEQSEVVLMFVDSGWDINSAIEDEMLTGMERVAPNRFRITDENAVIRGIEFPAETMVPAFVGYHFLTDEVNGTMEHKYHISQSYGVGADSLIGGVHFTVKRASRSLFQANAGSDVSVLPIDTITLTATDISEDAEYAWLNASGDTLQIGRTYAVNPSTSTTYDLVVTADADGYKDYDQVTVNVKLGLITSVAPNPATSTTTVAYRTTAVSTAQVVLVEVSTATEHPYTITPGNSSININLSGYNTGAYTVVLKGDGNVLDTKSLIIQ